MIKTCSQTATRQSSFGFTLVELLVTISIIGILFSAGVVSFRSMQAKGRDSKRIADLAVIQSALQKYRADKGFYPKNQADLYTVLQTDNYLSEVPKDPQTNTQYGYLAYPDNFPGCDNISTFCASYCLMAKLESDNGPDTCPPTVPNNYGVAPL